MKKILFVLILLIVTAQSFGAITFERSYDRPQYSTSVAVDYILPTTDHGYALLCSYDYDGLPARCLTKIDSLGNQQWQKPFNLGNGTTGSKLVQTADGGYLLAFFNEGITKFYNDTWLIKINDQGVFQWEKFITEGNDFGKTTSITTDQNNAYLAGFFRNQSKCFISKTTLTGDTLWTKKFDFTSNRLDPSVISIYNNANQLFVTAQNYLLCFNKNGVKLWQKSFIEPILNLECGDTLKVLTSSRNTGDVWAGVYTILSSGDSLSYQKINLNYDILPANLIINDLRLDKNSNLYAAGSLKTDKNKLWLAKFSTYGQSLWQYQTSQIGTSEAKALLTNADGGIIGVGKIADLDLNSKALVSKLDRTGQLENDASTFFPLQTGNVWEYECYTYVMQVMLNYTKSYQMRYECLNDTLLEDNNTYKKMRVTELRKNTISPIWYEYHRFDQPSKSLVIYDNMILPAGGTVNDTLAGTNQDYLCVQDQIDSVLGFPTRQKKYFSLMMDITPFYSVAQNIGLTYSGSSSSFSANGNDKKLVYTQINGIEYGTKAKINSVCALGTSYWDGPGLSNNLFNADTVKVKYSSKTNKLNLTKGSVLQFKPNIGLEIKGITGTNTNSAVIGTKDYPIKFIAADSLLGWKGITFSENQELKTTELNYCIIKNVRDSIGGALKIGKGNKVVITDCTIEDNESDKGGAIWAKESELSVKNSLLVRNKAIHGGAIYAENTNPYLLNNTIVDNQADSSGGGIYLYKSNMKIYNTILWQNIAPIGSQIYLADDQSDPWLINCNLQYGINGFGGNGSGSNYNGNYQQNISNEPGLATNYSLLNNSACINKGTADTNGLNLPDHDLAGNPRIYLQRVDIGAYESNYNSINDQLIPTISSLQNYPNPFNPSTLISYQITKENVVKLTVFNAKGELVVILINGLQKAGKYSLNFDGSGLNSGVYFCKLEVDGKNIVNKMLLLK